MELTFSEKISNRWISGNSMFFHAHDQDGNVVTVDLPLSDWQQLQDTEGVDAITRMPEIAQSGEWAQFGADRVWRVNLPGS